MNIPNLNNPFCQILNRLVNQETCSGLQESSIPRKCFGCGSPYRQCTTNRGNSEECKNLVAFPEITFCSQCLARELEQEKILPSEAPGGIRCNTCRERLIVYHDYELCLHCTVQTYQPLSEGTFPMDDSQHLGSAPAPPSPPHRRRSTVKIQPSDYMGYFDQAVDLAEKQKNLSPKNLHKNLGMGPTAAKHLLNVMTDRGILGPPRQGPGGRAFLKRPDPAPNGQTKKQAGALSTQTKTTNSSPILGQVLSPLRGVPPERARSIVQDALENYLADAQAILDQLRTENDQS